MNRQDFLTLVGAQSRDHDYLPVAILLQSGYACVGHFHSKLNEEMPSACVMLNAQVLDLRGEEKASGRPGIADFNEFLEEVVAEFSSQDGNKKRNRSSAYAKSVPLMAVSYEQIAVVYPVAHISELLKRAEKQETRLPTFLDLDQSEIIALLRTRLW